MTFTARRALVRALRRFNRNASTVAAAMIGFLWCCYLLTWS